MDAKVIEVAALRVAYLRAYGPYHVALPQTWRKFNAWIGQSRIDRAGRTFLTVCQDHPRKTPPGQIRGDACMTVDANFAPSGEIQVQVVPGGTCATATHVGAYAELGGSWNKLCQWVSANGMTMRGQSFEV
jgi:DNA gyrase inhibitor GyrI